MIDDYETMVFDCDGVILQSNALKSEAFSLSLKGYEPALVARFVDWHKANGGISRYEKFNVFFREMLNVEDWREQTEKAAKRFAQIVGEGLRTCPYIPGFETYLERIIDNNVPASVNTGGDQEEIRQVFEKRGIAKAFRRIYGSPAEKRQNMQKLKNDGLIMHRSVYFGDSQLDFSLAQEFSLDFVFVSHESEWIEGADVVKASGGVVIRNFGELG